MYVIVTSPCIRTRDERSFNQMTRIYLGAIGSTPDAYEWYKPFRCTNNNWYDELLVLKVFKSKEIVRIRQDTYRMTNLS